MDDGRTPEGLSAPEAHEASPDQAEAVTSSAGAGCVELDERESGDEMAAPSEGEESTGADAVAGVNTVEEEEYRRKRYKRKMGLCTVDSQYSVVRRCGKQNGFKPAKPDEEWSLWWCDGAVDLSMCSQMRRFQKVNHFPRMSEICRKDLLARNLRRLQSAFPKDYNFFPVGLPWFTSLCSARVRSILTHFHPCIQCQANMGDASRVGICY